MKTNPEMFVGDAVMAVLKGEIKQATRITENGNELILRKNNAGNLEIKLGIVGELHYLASPACLHENDAHGKWNVDYGDDLQPFENITVRFDRLQGGASFSDTASFRKTTWAAVKKDFESRGDFIEFLTVVGFNGSKVTILVGEKTE
jgi:hypothetical protein